MIDLKGNSRAGMWYQTWSGIQFWPCDPRPEEVCIEDIAHHLSLVNRFGGATDIGYSVAQHSVLVSFHCDPADAMEGLMHDSAEAYCGDMVRPIKHDLQNYQELEKVIFAAICRRFSLVTTTPDSVHLADQRALMTEGRDLLIPHPAPWGYDVEPWPERINPWPAKEAELNFLSRWRELGGEALVGTPGERRPR